MKTQDSVVDRMDVEWFDTISSLTSGNNRIDFPMKWLLFFTAVISVQLVFSQDTSYARVIKTFNKDKNFNGAALVATQGKINYIGAIGVDNRESGTAVNPKSIFKIASITKTFTAVMVMQLIEVGKLDLNAAIGKYFPTYKGEAKDKVTIEQLLTYSSGIPNCESFRGDTIYQTPVSRDIFINMYCSGKLESTPGTKFSYDNGDYVILGKIIENITGKSFEKNLKERILVPLNMQHSNMLRSKDKLAGLVHSYTYSDSTKIFTADKPYFIENYFSAGAMYSTVEDLLKFDQGIFEYKLLKKETVELMLTPHKDLDNVGLGFWISGKYGGLNSTFAYRPGGIYGASSNWIHLIDSNKAIIVFANTDATNLFEFSEQLSSITSQ